MQHDLRIEELRIGGSELYFWCVCGGWSGIQSDSLARVPIYKLFIEQHLVEVGPYVMHSMRYLNDPHSMRYLNDPNAPF